jgi:hypothetical protein
MSIALIPPVQSSSLKELMPVAFFTNSAWKTAIRRKHLSRVNPIYTNAQKQWNQQIWNFIDERSVHLGISPSSLAPTSLILSPNFHSSTVIPLLFISAQPKHLLRYIQGTKDYGLLFTANSSSSPLLCSEPHGFSDVSFASDPDDRKSTSGYLFFLVYTLISWSAPKQTEIALSTMESEYIAPTDAAKEAIFLRKLLDSLSLFTIARPTLIHTDSESALDHVKNNVKHPRTKHIDTRHHYIRSVYGT